MDRTTGKDDAGADFQMTRAIRWTEAQRQAYDAMYGRNRPVESPPVLSADLAGGMLLTVPMPPSVNSLYGTTADGQKFLTDEQRDYRRNVIGIVHIACKGMPPLYTNRLHLWMRLHFSNRRRTDIDSRIKAAFDALQHAKVYKDDSQIDKLTVERVIDPDGQEYASVEIREVA
jgi:crossover junction endodeoxyribonuclease RusA